METLSILLVIVVVILIAYIAYLRRERSLKERETDVMVEKRLMEMEDQVRKKLWSRAELL